MSSAKKGSGAAARSELETFPLELNSTPSPPSDFLQQTGSPSYVILPPHVHCPVSSLFSWINVAPGACVSRPSLWQLGDIVDEARRKVDRAALAFVSHPCHFRMGQSGDLFPVVSARAAAAGAIGEVNASICAGHGVAGSVSRVDAVLRVSAPRIAVISR